MTQVNRSNRKRKDSFIDNLTITDKEKKRIGRRWKFLKKKYNIPERKKYEKR